MLTYWRRATARSRLTRPSKKKRQKFFFPPPSKTRVWCWLACLAATHAAKGRERGRSLLLGFIVSLAPTAVRIARFVPSSRLSLSRARSLPTRESTTRQKQKNSSSFRFLKSKSQWLCKPKRIIVFDSKVPHIENNWIASLHNQDRLIHVRVFFYFPRPSRGKMLYFFNWWPIMLSSSCARVSSMWQTLKTNARLCRVGSCATGSSCDSPFPCWPDTCDTLGGNDLDLYPHSHLSPPPLNKVSLFRQVFC